MMDATGGEIGGSSRTGNELHMGIADEEMTTQNVLRRMTGTETKTSTFIAKIEKGTIIEGDTTKRTAARGVMVQGTTAGKIIDIECEGSQQRNKNGARRVPFKKSWLPNKALLFYGP